MAFDQTTRNRLARFVGEARALLTEEFTRQLQHEYGLDPANGTVTDLDRLTALDDARRETARILRETMEYYLGGVQANAKTRQDVLDRIVREQAFTVLNRLCALRMAEGRGLLIESVGRGYHSKGFQLYARLAGPALGETGEAYRSYLFSLFDEFAVDLPVLFDRFSPQGRLFPREATLIKLLGIINDPEIEPLWAEDETIGWIYQYFNSKEERQQMRAESSAPRNSRELAVRNQFFTPRYVVEFLTDNTLGRIWYEMTQGVTDLKETCRYLARRPAEVFLAEAATAGAEHAWDWSVESAHWLLNGDDQSFPPFSTDNDSRHRLVQLASVVDGYRRYPQPAIWEGWELVRMHRAIHVQEDLSSYSLQELLDVMFFMYRSDYWAGGEFLNDPHELRLIARLGNEVRRCVLVGRGEELSQEELLRTPVFIPYRPLKDPREIKMLDPACGSMHFGLYAFDLFELIYAEAWELEETLGQDALWRMAGLESLHQTYPDKETFLRDVPRLIIERNIHGIDIDPRAVQIAGLSLWLRAQKSWQVQGLKPSGRPQIRRSNIVCAEPMPGDRQMLEEFLKTMREDRLETWMREVMEVPAGQQLRVTKAMTEALSKLVHRMWQEMELAGEAGSLLKVEETLREAVATASKEAAEKPPLFRVLEYGQDGFDLARAGWGIPAEEQEFWNWAEALVLKALSAYSKQAANGAGYRRRMFTEDATQGFSFIDLLRKRYDFVLMNPPFGAITARTLNWSKTAYPNTYSNLGATFVERASNLLINEGKLGIIIDIATSIRSSYAGFRHEVLYKLFSLSSYISLGWEVLDANVEVCCYTVTKDSHSRVQIYCVDTTNSVDKGNVLDNCIAGFHRGEIISNGYLVFQEEFVQFPNGVPNFTLLPELRRLFVKFSALGKKFAEVKTGLSSGDNGRFYRLAWDVPVTTDENRWVPLSNGGEFLPFYRPFQEVIDWRPNGDIIKSNNGAFIRNEDYYFKRGLSYGKRGNYLAIHTHPRGRIFTNEGQAIFPNSDKEALYLLGVINSKICRGLINEYCGQHKENGYVSLIPIPEADKDTYQTIISIVASIIDILQSEHAYEIEHFEAIGLTKNYVGNKLETDIKHLEKLKNSLDQLEKELGLHIRDLYNISDKAYSYIEQKTSSCPSIYEAHFKQKERKDFIARMLFDQFVGIIIGRWDINTLSGRPPRKKILTTFDYHPVCPPGFLSYKKNPESIISDKYPIQICSMGILSSDENDPNNITLYIRKIVEFVWENYAEKIEQEFCVLTGVSSIGEYFENPNYFFDDHLIRYSKGRRSSPIYWPLSTPSNSYSLWLYSHRINDQTLFTCVNDFVDPKLKQVSEEASRLRQKRNRSISEEKELENLTDLERELKDFRAELLRVAAFWKPNLNDGVQITAAPLWKLFQHKPWQKKLKETWEKLEHGDYDWAHLAYSIWPERVREKCKTDKSLAIAHDLEELYVEPKASLKKKKGKKQAEMELEDLFDED